MNNIMIGWTTLGSEEEAKKLAKALIEEKLVACAQIDGPITSMYPWDGKLEESQEYRLTLKFPQKHLKSIEKELLNHHPYDTPQWLAAQATETLEDYSKWIQAVTAT